MKETGIIRRIDDLGRIAIPKEIRKTLKIKEGDPLELWLDRDVVCIKKYNVIAPIKNVLNSLIDLMKDEDVAKKISTTDRACVVSIANMLLEKWKESEDTE